MREWEQQASLKPEPQVGFTAVSDAFLVTMAEFLIDRAAPFSTTGQAHWLNKQKLKLFFSGNLEIKMHHTSVLLQYFAHSLSRQKNYALSEIPAEFSFRLFFFLPRLIIFENGKPIRPSNLYQGYSRNWLRLLSKIEYIFTHMYVHIYIRIYNS